MDPQRIGSLMNHLLSNFRKDLRPAPNLAQNSRPKQAQTQGNLNMERLLSSPPHQLPKPLPPFLNKQQNATVLAAPATASESRREENGSQAPAVTNQQNEAEKAHPFSAMALAADTCLQEQSPQPKTNKLELVNRWKRQNFEKLCAALKNDADEQRCVDEDGPRPEKRSRTSDEEASDGGESSSLLLPPEYLTYPAQQNLEVHSVKAADGEDLIETMKKFLMEHDFKNLFIFSCHGGLKSVQFKAPKGQENQKLEGEFRIISLNGNVSHEAEAEGCGKSLNLQIALTRKDGGGIFAGEVEESAPLPVHESCVLFVGGLKIAVNATEEEDEEEDNDDEDEQSASSALSSSAAESQSYTEPE
ncbi:hypothetical protein Ciccas_006691 [Cichlidogyrus casuarinus]|uniref:PPC domain-containing protein n=1 Tax=Cichlidogyrus casuarinus TaxID=1844966 RepID=A0ABD2Q8W5_9PLAT